MRHEGLVSCALIVLASAAAGCGSSSTSGAAGPSDAVAGAAMSDGSGGVDAAAPSVTDGSSRSVRMKTCGRILAAAPE